MHHRELEEIFAKTLEDRRLSRTERQALGELFADLDADPETRAGYMNRAFAAAEAAMTRQADRQVLDWLLGVVKTIHTAATPRAASSVAEVLFEPQQNCGARLRELIDRARSSIWICVFTLTDDRLARAILAAHRRGVAVRIITDDDKSFDRGSDIRRLAEAGIPVAMDQSPAHMHHKFALFDQRIAVTGSYNWTRGAAEQNHENIVVTDDERLVERFRDEFERLWTVLGLGA